MSGSQEPVPQPVPVPPSQPAAPPTPPPPPPPPEEDMTNMDMDISGDFEHGFNNEIIPPPPPPPDLDLPPPPPLQVPLPPPMIIDNILPPANFVPPPQNFRGGMKRGGGQGHCFFPYSEPRFPPPGPGPSTSANANSQPLGALNRFGPGSHRNGDPHEGDPIAMLPPNPANRPRLPAPPLMQQGFPPPMVSMIINLFYKRLCGFKLERRNCNRVYFRAHQEGEGEADSEVVRQCAVECLYVVVADIPCLSILSVMSAVQVLECPEAVALPLDLSVVAAAVHVLMDFLDSLG